MTDEQLVQRAVDAQRLLNDPLLVEAWEGLEQGAIQRLAAADTHDTKLLQTQTMALQTVRVVRRRFEVWVAEGEAAAQRLIEREERPRLLDSLANRFRRTA